MNGFYKFTNSTLAIAAIYIFVNYKCSKAVLLLLFQLVVQIKPWPRQRNYTLIWLMLA